MFGAVVGMVIILAILAIARRLNSRAGFVFAIPAIAVVLTTMPLGAVLVALVIVLPTIYLWARRF